MLWEAWAMTGHRDEPWVRAGLAGASLEQPAADGTRGPAQAAPSKWLKISPKSQGKGHQRNRMRAGTKSWDKTNSSRKGAGGSKSA